MRTTSTPASSRAAICVGLVPRRAEGGDDLGAANGSAGHGMESNAGGQSHHCCITTSPATTVSAARPARTASPSSRSDRGIEVPGDEVGILAGASLPRAGRRPPAAPRRGIGAHRVLEARASPPAASRRSARRRRPGARAPRTPPRGDRSTRPARRCRTPSACRGAESARKRRLPRPRAPQCRSTSGMSVSRCAGCMETTMPRGGGPVEIGGVHALEVLDAVRNRRPGQRGSSGRAPAGPRHRRWRGPSTRCPPRRPLASPRAASASVVIGMPRSRLPSYGSSIQAVRLPRLPSRNSLTPPIAEPPGARAAADARARTRSASESTGG